MHYCVEPGLYALGDPDGDSPVFVTASYKMSFDELRKSLPGRNGWVLVLDTGGINVWCAAGKNTFGTAELVERIGSSGLAEVVSHRKLILPQLAAPGVSAHRVKKISGFEVIYGPIKASDLPAFLDNRLKATREMRRKTFTFRERMVLVPVELAAFLKKTAIALPVVLLLSGFGGPGDFWSNVSTCGAFSAGAILTAVLGGTILVPALLPWLPGRAFSLKGFEVGLALAFLLIPFGGFSLSQWSGRFESLAWLLLMPAVTGYIGMNFTGSSTYTSLSGVRREMRLALPLQITGGAVGLILWLAALFFA